MPEFVVPSLSRCQIAVYIILHLCLFTTVFILIVHYLFLQGKVLPIYSPSLIVHYNISLNFK